jgi:hypothetical protein
MKRRAMRHRVLPPPPRHRTWVQAERRRVSCSMAMSPTTLIVTRPLHPGN